MAKYYVVEGAELQCSLGTEKGFIKVLSNDKVKIKGKLKATSEDKTLEPPFFKNCKCKWYNPPCKPELEDWKFTSKRSKKGNKTFLMDISQVPCKKGGLIKITNTGQDLVGTGTKDADLDKLMPKLHGEILFVNGYLSDSLGGSLNAVLDKNPDKKIDPDSKDHFKKFRGKNVNEENRADEADYMPDAELDAMSNYPEIKKKIDAHIEEYKKVVHQGYTHTVEGNWPFPITTSPPISPLSHIPVHIPIKSLEPVVPKNKLPPFFKGMPDMTKKERKAIFWGYWNSIENKYKATDTYAKYFNAEGNEHFFNGSHGLSSNAAHRMDHGIALGYHWAKHHWVIMPKEEIEAIEETQPGIHSYTPSYKPITIVMHSQGNAPGAGIAMGIMKYAAELGYEEIPLNLIFLGVHQPKNLWGNDYKNFVKAKVDFYYADTDFRDVLAYMAFKKNREKDRDVHTHMNALAELFSLDHHKLRNFRGIYEHLKAIGDFEAMAKRAVQFTFSNDRGDMVIRDGDIPFVKSACDPSIDTTLFSVEYFEKNVPEHYKTKQNKEIIPLNKGGYVVVPPYAAIPRIHIVADADSPDGRKKEYWKDYRSIAIDWGNAMTVYRRVKKHTEKMNNRKLSLIEILSPPLDHMRQIIDIGALKLAFMEVVFHYARIQAADLYAHFSPVSLLHDTDLLSDEKVAPKPIPKKVPKWSILPEDQPDKQVPPLVNHFNDQYGTQNIWERIKKAGADRFYRVDYTKSNDLEELTTSEKRLQEKEFVEKQNSKDLLNSTAFVKTNIYIQNVIKAFVEGNPAYEKFLYEEPNPDNTDFTDLQKKLGITPKDFNTLKEIEQQKFLERYKKQEYKDFLQKQQQWVKRL